MSDVFCCSALRPARHLVSVVVIGKMNLDCVHLLKFKAVLPKSSKLVLSSQPYPCADLRLLPFSSHSRKEMFQPHLPVRLPCYDLAPVNSFTLGRSLRVQTSGTTIFHGLTGGVYKARERIHRAMADARLLANPASWSRVADSNPNWEQVS